MTWKTIEAAREIRQWTTQIVIPTVAVGVAIAVTPEGATWFHEHGHLIDDALGTVSNDKQFKVLLNEDVYQYRIRYGKEHNLRTYDKVDKTISGDLQDMRKHSAVSDLLDGLTSGNIRGCAGHMYDYWDNLENITSEAFAHMFESQFDKVRYDEMKKYFPQSLEYFEKKLKEAAK